MKYSESNVHENILKALDEIGFVDMYDMVGLGIMKKR